MSAAALSIKLRCASWQQLATIYKRDLSKGTMFLKASTPPPVGTAVRIDLTLPSASVIVLQGTVEEHVNDPTRGAGVELKLAPIPAGSVWMIESALASESAAGRGRTVTPAAGVTATVASQASQALGPVMGMQEGEDLAAAEAELVRALVSEAESLKKLNPFLVLGVGYEASDVDVRAAFGELTKRYHPDRFARYQSTELRQTAAEIFILIRDAYRRLGDDAGRQQALATLGRSAAPRAVAAPRPAGPPPVPPRPPTSRLPAIATPPGGVPITAPPIAAPHAHAAPRAIIDHKSGAVRAVTDPKSGPIRAVLDATDTPPRPRPAVTAPLPASAKAGTGPLAPIARMPRPGTSPIVALPRAGTSGAPLPPPPSRHDVATADGDVEDAAAMGNAGTEPAVSAGSSGARPVPRPPGPITETSDVGAIEELLDAGRVDDALAAYRLLAKKHPADRNFRAGIELCEGLNALAQRDRLEAAQRFESALEIDPSNERAARELADMRRQATNERKGLLSRLMGKKEP